MQNNSEKLLKRLGADHLKAALPANEARKIKLAASGLAFMNLVLRGLQKLLYKKIKDPKKILVFRTGSLGDSVCATPALQLIRTHYPGAHISLLSNAGGKSLVSPENVIDPGLYNDMIDYLGLSLRHLLQLLRKQKFDMVIQLPQVEAPFLRLIRDIFFLRMVAPAGWGWKTSRILLFRKQLEKYVFYPNEAQRLLWICSDNGLEATDTAFRLNFTNEDQQIVNDYFNAQSLDGKQVIAIAVGANSVKNRWPIKYFAEVINHFRVSNPVLLVGGPEDNALVEPFVKLPGVYNCCGIFTPMQSALLIKKSSLAITNDTGPLHLSYAVGTPLIGLFAARDFYGKWFPPLQSVHRVFRTPDVACSLCFFKPCDDNICMKAILPGTVIKAAEELIESE